MSRALLYGLIAVGVAVLVWWWSIPGPNSPSSVDPIEYADLERIVTMAARENDPWVLSHAMLALSPGGEGPRSTWIEALTEEWLRRDEEGRPFFPLHVEVGRGEQHPHLVMKALAEVGVESGDPAAISLALELAARAVARATPPDDWREWNDTAWFLHGIATLTAHGKGSWSSDTVLGAEVGAEVGAGGWTIGRLATEALARVEEGDRVIEEALGVAGPFVRPAGDGPPTTAGTYAYTCGGQHLLQAVVAAFRAGFLPDTDRDRVAARIGILVQRLDAEEDFRAREEKRALAAGVSAIRAARFRAAASLKLHGHGLETLALAHEALPRSRPGIELAMERTVTRVRELIRTRVQLLDPDGTIAPRLREEDPVAWEMWFGDGCHALHGLTRARVRLGGKPWR